MILASAGSGKTYALTNRFVRLLALGAAPERIVALTFTRKAAGEFFDEILNKLARAASEPAYANKLARELGIRATDHGSGEWRSNSEQSDDPDFLRLLRRVTDAMHRLRLGTFDGFFARIARNFPLELGLTGEFELLEEHAARMERARVLRRIFERTGGLDESQREFVEAFKRATFGLEEKRLGAQLDEFLERHQEAFLNAPARDAWGNPQRIWPDGSRWLGPCQDPRQSIEVLRSWIATATIADKQRVRWVEFLDACAAWSAGIVPTRPLLYVMEKALAAWPALESGRAVLEFDRKKQELDPAPCAALAGLVRHVVGGEISRRIEMTCGIHAVLTRYESVYHELVRRAGKLSFADVQRLLQPGSGAPLLSSHAPAESEPDPGSGAEEGGGDQLELLSFDAAGSVLAAAETAERRLLIDYRLDGEVDHWMLDEFQDTSYGQWSVLRNLIDEVVQDPTGTRSFFYVGDVKQAIFAWRDGDPRLFREIFDHYNAIRPGTIAEEHLVRSWRSGPAVIAAVNRVFGDDAVLGELFPGAASSLWSREWRAHESAQPQTRGQVALLCAGGAGMSAAAAEQARFAAALELLREIEPIARGLSCALLVQKNSTATALADYLRREGGIPAMAESDLHVCTDNPLGAALLALAKVAAHPGDTLAWEHVQMTPLGEMLAAEGLRTPEAVTRRILGEVHAEGFERTMSAWVRRLESSLPSDDEFSRERARQFAAAAGLFDATGSRDVAEFIAFMERHAVRDLESTGALRVMTIHKSKGLGFDVVILPDLEGQRLDSRREGLAIQRAADRTVEWVLDLPGKLFHECDEALARHVRAAEADACYEALSLLYVAMTRAKRAMYLIVKAPGASTSRNYPRLLVETLGGEEAPIRVGGREFAGFFGEGDPEWHLGFLALDAESVEGARPPVPAIPPLPASAKRSPRLIARRPSAAGGKARAAAGLFSLARADGSEFGTVVHRLFAEIGAKDAAQREQLVREWLVRGELRAAIEEARACLEAPVLEHVWAVGRRCEVWCERAFEIVLDGFWITGVFDRVIVERDARGRPVRATVFDFKTDRVSAGGEVDALVRRHEPQIDLYRRVAAVLTRLPREAVEAQLVFTRMRLSRVVSPG